MAFEIEIYRDVEIRNKDKMIDCNKSKTID